MAIRKLYAGAKLREIRTRLGLTQKDFAAKLGVSLPYLNQMENNNRPVSTAVLLALAQEFGFDVTELSTGDAERLISDMREALADPVFGDDPPPLNDLRLPPPTRLRWPAPFSTCTAPTGKPMSASPASMRRWGARIAACSPRLGTRCAISSIIATTISTPWTARPSISRQASPRSAAPAPWPRRGSRALASRFTAPRRAPCASSTASVAPQPLAPGRAGNRHVPDAPPGRRC
jgi:transcriptional regulator with XRE-family HTH domain